MPDGAVSKTGGPGRRAAGLRLFLARVAPGLFVTALVLVLHLVNLPATVELGHLVFDAYQRASPRPYQDAGVRVVDIDDESIAKLGQWPWPRTDIARLNDGLAQAGAVSIAYDIVFSEPDRTSPARMAEVLRRNPEARGDYAEIARLPDHDLLLGQSFAKTPSVTGYFLTREPTVLRPPTKAGFAIAGAAPLASLPEFKGVIAPIATIGKDASGAGFVSIVGGRDGIVRAAPLLAHVGDQITPALSLEALRVAQGAGAITVKANDASGEVGGNEPGVVAVKVGQFAVPTTRTGELWMYYTAPHPQRVTPAWKILTGALSPAEMKTLFDGRIVLVGTGASGLRDLVATPISERELGVVVHAQALEQMILQRFLTRPDWDNGLERFLVLVLGLGMTLTLPGLGAVRGGMVAALAFAAAVASSWVAFSQWGLLLDPTFPALGVIAVYIAGTLFSFLREERARLHIHQAFDRYLSPALVDRIAKDPRQLELGGEEREVTVMFCDIRSFSRISEKLSPKSVIGFLIDFLTPMTEILLSRKATIDKYIGDAILAFWNAPLDDPEHERNAAFATLQMVERLTQINAEQAGTDSSTWPGEVKVGIGLGTGPACVGNIGSRQRLNYSLIGDTVNLASRLEGLTKFYGISIAINEQLAGRIQDFALIEVDLVRVVGRDTPTRVFALLGSPELAATPAFRQLAEWQAAFLCAYRTQNWAEAEAARSAFSALADPFGLQTLAALYRRRLNTFRTSPPRPDWDGVYAATEK